MKKKSSPRSYSEEKLIALLQEKAAELGETPNMKHVDSDPGMPSVRSYYRCFGSWGKAIEMAGLTMRPDCLHRYSDEELIVALRKKVAEFGRIPTHRDVISDPDFPSIGAFIAHFGSWNEALETVGLKNNRPKGLRRSDEELIMLLQEKAAELGRVPLRKNVDDDPNMPSTCTYANHFGSWNRALGISGVKDVYPEESIILSEEELILLLQRKAAELGEAPTMKNVENDPDMPHANAYVKVFGNWGKALDAAGLKELWSNSRLGRKGRKVFTNGELIVLLQMEAAKLGRTPRIEDVEYASDMPCATTFRKHFGSWSRALEAAGLLSSKKTKSKN